MGLNIRRDPSFNKRIVGVLIEKSFDLGDVVGIEFPDDSHNSFVSCLRLPTYNLH